MSVRGKWAGFLERLTERNLWWRLSRDQSGATAVEFAMVSVPFLLFIFSIFQVAIYHFSLQALDYATRKASRQIMTAQISSQGMTVDQFKSSVLCPALLVPLDCSKITVIITKVEKTSNKLEKTGIYAFLNSSATALRPANLDASVGSFCSGSGGEYLFVDVAYKFQNFINFSLGGGNTIDPDYWVLRSTNFIYNEPFKANIIC